MSKDNIRTFNFKPSPREFILRLFDKNIPVITIENDYSVTSHFDDSAERGAKIFYESLTLEGQTLHDKIRSLEKQLAIKNEDLSHNLIADESSININGTSDFKIDHYEGKDQPVVLRYITAEDNFVKERELKALWRDLTNEPIHNQKVIVKLANGSITGAIYDNTVKDHEAYLSGRFIFPPCIAFKPLDIYCDDEHYISRVTFESDVVGWLPNCL